MCHNNSFSIVEYLERITVTTFEQMILLVSCGMFVFA